ncbi:PAS domain S-box protein [Cesiribacter sp. SM1]|uniref:PAS domain S-box protein n=1 Tax=Cesiribacter sp. SM1 TaxID=2861196 RepID=UPI001CD4109D|nr:PAS domain S-box protein [Cesiribacter sp. SM1]
MEVSRDVSVWEKIIKNSLDIICALDQNGCYTKVNEACKNILGYSQEEMIGQSLRCFIHPDDLDRTLLVANDVIKGQKINNFENRYIHKAGHEVYMMWSGAWLKEDGVVICVGRDITEQKKARQKNELHQAIVEHGVDMLAMLDQELNYLHSEGSIHRQMGYTNEQLIGTNALNYIHPDDISLATDLLSKILTSSSYIKVPDYRFKNAKGEWRWIETTISNQLNNPEVRALVANSRDVTERIETRLKLRESEQRFKSLFENHLDIVLFQDREGIIIDANATTLSFFGVEKEEILNHPFSYFLTPEVIPICDKALRDALNGEWVRYEATIPFEGKGTYTFDIAKIPVVVNGSAIGVYSILRDVTEIHQYNKTIRRQAEKLNNIMESITDAFFTLDKNWIFTYVNSEFDRILHTNREQLIGKSIWDIFPEELNGEFHRHYSEALETGKSAHFEAYLKHLDVWLQVKAFPSEEGLSVYFDDVTEKVKSRLELERLSLVASKITNGVVITDADGLIEWVNEGFVALTGYTLPEVAGKAPVSFLTGEETDKIVLERFIEKRMQSKPFHEEMLNYKKSGEKIWLLLEVTPVLNEAGKVSRFITIQSDISYRKEVEESQLQLTKDLFNQNRDLQQFTYIVSHNLRSPVANAMGLVDILSMISKDSAEFNTSLNFLRKSVNQLDTVLRDLNMILSIRDKRDTIDRESIPLALVCQQAISDLSEPLHACGAEVKMGIDESINVQGDKAYIYSIFHNLLSNAIKYRASGRSLVVNIECMSNTGTGTTISLSDNGSGFDTESAGDKVFKLYKRFHANSDGRGIGLFLVKTHLDAMGGHIEVTSEVNVGTRFLIYFK